MEFLVGFLLGGVCVVFLLVWWGRHPGNPSSSHPPTAPTESRQAYETVITNLEEESDQFLRELHETFSAYSTKRR